MAGQPFGRSKEEIKEVLERFGIKEGAAPKQGRVKLVDPLAYDVMEAIKGRFLKRDDIFKASEESPSIGAYTNSLGIIALKELNDPLAEKVLDAVKGKMFSKDKGLFLKGMGSKEYYSLTNLLMVIALEKCGDPLCYGVAEAVESRMMHNSLFKSSLLFRHLFTTSNALGLIAMPKVGKENLASGVAKAMMESLYNPGMGLFKEEENGKKMKSMDNLLCALGLAAADDEHGLIVLEAAKANLLSEGENLFVNELGAETAYIHSNATAVMALRHFQDDLADAVLEGMKGNMFLKEEGLFNYTTHAKANGNVAATAYNNFLAVLALADYSFVED